MTRSNKRARFDDIFIIILISDTCHTCHPPHTYVYIVSIITICASCVFIIVCVSRAHNPCLSSYKMLYIWRQHIVGNYVLLWHDTEHNISLIRKSATEYLCFKEGDTLMRRRMRLMINIIKASTLCRYMLFNASCV